MALFNLMRSLGCWRISKDDSPHSGPLRSVFKSHNRITTAPLGSKSGVVTIGEAQEPGKHCNPLAEELCRDVTALDRITAISDAFEFSIDTSIYDLPTQGLLKHHVTNTFSHQALDRNMSSIRLVKISEELSEGGLLQCQIFHATTEVPYVCLSYVWDYPARSRSSMGQEDTQQLRAILMNRRLRLIRKNLFDFLHMARHIGAQGKDQIVTRFDLHTPIWIDDLCIDQSNILERNHQVAQMGLIYSCALSVQVWLGKLPQSLSMETQSMADIDLELQEELYRASSTDKASTRTAVFDKIFYDCLVRNPYWERTWIMQEIFLAQRLRFWLHSVSMDPQTLHKLGKRAINSSWTPKACRPEPYGKFPASFSRRHIESSLIPLLSQFPARKSSEPLDRIYSLLPLCPDEKLKLEVNYEISLGQLAYRVLHCQSELLCMCTVMIVVQALRGGGYYESDVADDDLDLPWVECVIPATAMRYEHDSPARRVEPSQTIYHVPTVLDFRAFCRHNSHRSLWGDKLGIMKGARMPAFEARLIQSNGGVRMCKVRMSFGLIMAMDVRIVCLYDVARDTNRSSPASIGWGADTGQQEQ